VFTQELTHDFIQSRRDGLSQGTLDFYNDYLSLSKSVIGIHVTGQQVREFLNSLHCSNGGKHAYYRALHAFYGWMYSPRSGYGLNSQDNPMIIVEPPKVERRILPALSTEQINQLIDQSASVRDKAIICLFTDTGLRLSELASIKPQNIDWGNHLIKVWCKGNKEGLAPFGERTESLLREWLSQHEPNGNIWGMGKWDIIEMLRRLRAKTNLPCNPHVFRRSFATVLAKRGIDALHIMRLGRWESIQMVERYTKSVRFEDSLKMYTPIMS